MVVYSVYKFHEIPSIAYQVMGEECIHDDTPITFHVHNLTMDICIQYRFNESSSIGYLVMVEDGKIIEI